MSGQTGAIMLDAYRELNARKLFWVVMILSVLVILACATVGVTDDTVSFLWWKLPQQVPNVKLFYKKRLFSSLIIGFYLTWVAAILALVSTASIFPDFLTGGSIDLYLSKPIGRGRLFLLKYLSGLLFVTLQVTAFSVGSFLVMGLRAQMWEPSLFLAIPIVVVFFSYLYGICVLAGVVTRSAMAALLLTVLTWFFIWTLDKADTYLTSETVAAPQRQKLAQRELESLDRRIASMEKRLGAETQSASQPMTRSGVTFTMGNDLDRARSQRARIFQLTQGPAVPDWETTAQSIVSNIKTFVPKTRETVALLDRYLLPDEELDKAVADDSAADARAAQFEMRNLDPTRGRSIFWVVGSSLGFEAVVVGLAMWIFKRRDF